MKTMKYFMLLAAVLLSSATAFAQSGNSEPLKGDVNEDGKVDFADVAAILQIMKDGGGTSGETIYYWYVGVENPSSIGTIQPDLTKPGWHLIGNSTDGWSYDIENENKIVLEDSPTPQPHYYYVVIPNTLHIYASDGVTLSEGIVMLPVTSSIDGYNAWKSGQESISAKGIFIK
jgi:hypothetical protein